MMICSSKRLCLPVSRLKDGKDTAYDDSFIPRALCVLFFLRREGLSYLSCCHFYEAAPVKVSSLSKIQSRLRLTELFSAITWWISEVQEALSDSDFSLKPGA